MGGGLPTCFKQSVALLSSTPPFHSRSTILVKLHTGDQPEFQYQPGDHVGIFPANRPALVQELLERIEDPLSAGETLAVESLEAGTDGEGGADAGSLSPVGRLWVASASSR